MRVRSINHLVEFAGLLHIKNRKIGSFPLEEHTFFANFLSSSLKAAYINITTYENTSNKWTHRFVRNKKRQFYKELSTEYEPVNFNL